MAVAGLAAAALCAGTAGLGCMIIVGAVVGAGLGAANYGLNHSSKSASGYFSAAGRGAVEGGIAGLTTGSALGRELRIGKNFRIAPGGNRGRGRFQLPHYHRRITDSGGNTVPGGGIKWQRPWQRGW